MIIYNVTVQLDAAIAEEWLAWMKDEHMPELMATGLFTGKRLCRLLEQDETEGPTYVAQYFCADERAYQHYIEHHASAMREKGLARFGNRFVAFRTLMAVEPE